MHSTYCRAATIPTARSRLLSGSAASKCPRLCELDIGHRRFLAESLVFRRHLLARPIAMWRQFDDFDLFVWAREVEVMRIQHERDAPVVRPPTGDDGIYERLAPADSAPYPVLVRNAVDCLFHYLHGRAHFVG